MRLSGLIAALLLSACGAPDSDGDKGVSENRITAENRPAPTVQAGAPARPPAAAPAAQPCLIQDGEPVAGALRAIGTEPFWNARIEGRCVTYSNPEDQKGTRIWTRFTPGPGGGMWSGSLDGRRFELRIRPGADCSDGMSDRRYPLVAELLVGGERRMGCAEPDRVSAAPGGSR